MHSSDPRPIPEAAGTLRTELADRWRPGPPPVLLAARCRACGRLSFPARPRCPGCWHAADAVALPRRGALYTFTTVHVGRPGGEAPLVLGYADFGGVRVLGPLTGAPPRIGAAVRVDEATAGPADSPSRRYVFRVDEP